jgi:preprotein translocase subunit SecD
VFLPTAVPAIIDGGWSVNAQLRPGAGGEDAFNAVAASCFGGAATCPSQRLAIVVDGRIVTAPTVNVPSFAGDVQIAGAFPEAEAADIASTINVAALVLSIEPG